MCVLACGGLVGFYTCYVKKDSRKGYQTIKKKVPVATMNSTTRQECVGELDNRSVSLNVCTQGVKKFLWLMYWKMRRESLFL